MVGESPQHEELYSRVTSLRRLRTTALSEKAVVAEEANSAPDRTG